LCCHVSFGTGYANGVCASFASLMLVVILASLVKLRLDYCIIAFTRIPRSLRNVLRVNHGRIVVTSPNARNAAPSLTWSIESTIAESVGKFSVESKQLSSLYHGFNS
jgi:hypothetical protein